VSSVAAAQPASVSLFGRARHRIRTRVTEHPALYLPMARAKRALRLDVRDLQRQVINSRTELVIEGYTRCGTTFAVYALQLSQERPVPLAHHWHASAQIIEAAHRNIPALLVIRKPEDAILSQLVREPNVLLHDALVAYSRFYERLLPYRQSFVVGGFEQVTRDFGLVVRRLNARFGTSFAEFLHTDANVRECLELIKRRGTPSKALFDFENGQISRAQMERELQNIAGSVRLPGASDAWDSSDAWVPSEDRQRAKDALREQWSAPSLARLRERARLVYEAHVSTGLTD
jgi:hypothetical protein